MDTLPDPRDEATPNVAARIEHTLLGAKATPADITRVCEEALMHGFRGVCINPCYVPLAKRLLAGRCLLVSVVDFPLGAGSERSVLAETEALVAEGADELDLVIPIGLAVAMEWGSVERRVRAVRGLCEGQGLKLILETGYFEGPAIERLSLIALDCGVDYLKTSTGFGPRGASVEDVRLLHSLAAGRAQIKASGGIRDLATARAMLQAGATRLGTSSGVAIAEEWRRAGLER